MLADACLLLRSWSGARTDILAVSSANMNNFTPPSGVRSEQSAVRSYATEKYSLLKRSPVFSLVDSTILCDTAVVDGSEQSRGTTELAVRALG